MQTEQIHKKPDLVFYNVQMKRPGILKYMFPTKENKKRMKLATHETKTMFKSHIIISLKCPIGTHMM